MLGAELGSKKILKVVEEHPPIMKRERWGQPTSEVLAHWKGRGAVPRDVAGCLLSALDSDLLGTLPSHLLVSD